MESNNIVIKMCLLYTGDKCAENNSRRTHCALLRQGGVTATKGGLFRLTSEDTNFYRTKIGPSR